MGAQCSTPARCCNSNAIEAHDRANIKLRGSALMDRGKRVAGYDCDYTGEYQVMNSQATLLYRSDRVCIFKAKQKKTGHFRACVLPREGSADMDCWASTVEVLQRCDHPHIGRLFEHFAGGKAPCLVMELWVGRSLAQHCKSERGSLSEAMSGLLLRQVTSAVAHVHSHGYCHLELSPEDFCFSKVTSRVSSLVDLNLKLVTMGLAKRIGPSVPAFGERAKFLAYTSQGRSPEQQEAGKDAVKICHDSVDVWAIGTIAVFVLKGVWPAVEQGALKGASLSGIDQKGKQFCQSCLQVEPRRRPSAATLLESSRFLDDAHQAYRQALAKEDEKSMQCAGGRSILAAHKMSADTIIKAFQAMASMSRLQRAAVTAAVHRLPEEKTRHIRRTFDQLDANGNGSLSVKELVIGLGNQIGSMGSNAELASILERIDTDGSRSIDFTEFVTATYAARKDLREEVCAAVFALFDNDRSGSVTIAEIKKALGIDPAEDDLTSRSTADTALDIFDEDGDGEIDFEEFKKILKGEIGGDSDSTWRPSKTSAKASRSKEKMQDEKPKEKAPEKPRDDKEEAREEDEQPKARYGSEESSILGRAAKAIQWTSQSSASSAKRGFSLKEKALSFMSTGSPAGGPSAPARAASAIASGARSLRRAVSRDDHGGGKDRQAANEQASEKKKKKKKSRKGDAEEEEEEEYQNEKPKNGERSRSAKRSSKKKDKEPADERGEGNDEEAAEQGDRPESPKSPKSPKSPRSKKGRSKSRGRDLVAKTAQALKGVSFLNLSFNAEKPREEQLENSDVKEKKPSRKRSRPKRNSKQEN